MRKNKKGVALIYVIIASAALLILSGVVAVSAMRNMGLTGGNRLSRYAYDRDKAAIEFAKGVLKQEYDADSTGGSGLRDFSVTAVTDGSGPYNCKYGALDIDGTKVFAKCEIKEVSDGSYTATITAGYPSSNSDKSKLFKMKYTASCTLEGNGLSSNFVNINCKSYGGQNGAQVLLKNGNPSIFSTSIEPYSDFPILLSNSVRTAAGEKPVVRAPQLYFIGNSEVGELNYSTGPIEHVSLYMDNSTNLTMYSNFICIANNIAGLYDKDNYWESAHTSLKAAPNYWPEDVKYDNPVIYFPNNIVIYRKDRNDQSDHSVQINAGYYYYEDGTDLFSDNVKDQLTKITDTDTIDELEKNNNYEALASNFAGNNNLISSEETSYGGTNWTVGGKLAGDGAKPSYQKGKTVYMCANNVGFSMDDWAAVLPTSSEAISSNGKSYAAEEIYFQYNGRNDLQFPDNRAVVLEAKNIVLDTVNPIYNNAFPCFFPQGSSGGSKFIIKYARDENGSIPSKKVTLTLVNDLKIRKQYEKSGSGYHYVGYNNIVTIPAGVYSVPSGTDLFSLTEDDWSGMMTSDDPSTGGLGSGVGGGFSGGEYSW